MCCKLFGVSVHNDKTGECLQVFASMKFIVVYRMFRHAMICFGLHSVVSFRVIWNVFYHRACLHTHTHSLFKDVDMVEQSLVLFHN